MVLVSYDSGWTVLETSFTPETCKFHSVEFLDKNNAQKDASELALIQSLCAASFASSDEDNYAFTCDAC
jgi:hypothetical protein